ncbi:MAG: c-type cytochrome [Mariprofundaceae bacterium]
MAAVQAALDQVVDARDAIKRADDDKVLALQEVEQRREAVKQAITLATQESEVLKKDAAMRTRWAQTTHDQAVATRKLLLKAAMEQSDTKALLAEKEKAFLEMRMLDEKHQDDAKLAMLGQLKADKLLAVVVEAERIASLSIDLVTPNSGIGNNNENAFTTHAQNERRNVKIAKNSTPTSSKTAKQHIKKTSSKAKLKLASINTSPNAQRGHGLAQKCQSCHTFEPNQKGKFGPNLFGVVGQQAGKSNDYKYGAALANADFAWDEEKLTQWICNSGKTIKQLTGNKYAVTKMTTQRICGQDAKDVVAYLRTLKAQASAKTTSGS